jgi:serine/threonine protein kinase
MLSDFGCARLYPIATNPSALVNDTIGSPAFWAPECVQPNKYANCGDLGLDIDYSTSINTNIDSGDDIIPDSTISYQYSAYLLDIWAWGITIYILLYGSLPYPTSNNTSALDIFNYIGNTDIEIPRPIIASLKDREDIYTYIETMLMGLLAKHPAERWSLDNLRDYLLPIV